MAYTFVGTALNIDSITGLNQIDFASARNNLTNTANQTAANANFGADNPFGNFSQGIQVFWNVIGVLSGGTILNVLGAIGLPPYFILPLQVIIVIFVVFALIYLITGRGSELSA